MSDKSEQIDTAVKNLSRYTISGLTATALKFILRLGKSILFIRLLGPSGRGVFGLLLTVPSLVVSFGNLGFGLGNVHLAAGKKVDLKYLLGNTLAFSLIHGPILCGVGLLLYYLNSQGVIALEGADQIETFVLVAIPLLLFHNFVFDLLMGVRFIYFMNFLDVLFSFLPMALLLAFWPLTGDVVRAAMFAWIVSVALVAALGFGHMFRRAGGGLRFSRTYLKEALSFGLRGNISMFANAIVQRSDILFLAHYQGLDAVGIYAAAVALVEILLALPNTVSVPFLPLRMEMDDETGRQFSPLVVKYVLFVMFLICLVTAAAAKPAIYILYGSQFQASFRPVLMLLPGILALSVYQFLKADMLSLGRPGLVSLVSVGTMTANVLLNFLFIPGYGPEGAAIATSISYALSSSILVIYLSRKTGIGINRLLFINRAEMDLLKDKTRDILARFIKKKPAGDL